MKLSWLCSLIVVLGACCCSASATEASLILVNAKLWTENPAQPTAQAVALDGSRILAVGNNAAIRKLAGPDTRIIDLGGRLLLPGFNDSHVHFLIGGGSLLLASAAMVGTNDVAPLAPALPVARIEQQADTVSRLRFWLICSTALGCILAGPALAETDASATPSAAPAVTTGTPSPSDTNSASQPLGEIVVTAQKRAENVQNVPLSIVAVSGQTLTAQGITDVLELQRFIPDLRLDTIQQAAGVSLRIRGIGSFSNAAIDPDVAPYIDGVFIPRAGAILTSFLDVDDVEVLRGPQGTLFGRNAAVGAISIRSNSPSFAGDSGSLAVEGGNFGRYKVEGIGNWAVNDSFALRAAAFDSHTDGWFKNTFDGRPPAPARSLPSGSGVRSGGGYRSRLTPDKARLSGRVIFNCRPS
jgi:hypothetical protein